MDTSGAPKRCVLMHFDPDGSTKIEAEGFEGGTCMDATAPFEQLFGKVEKQREMVGACVGPRRDDGERVFSEWIGGLGPRFTIAMLMYRTYNRLQRDANLGRTSWHVARFRLS